uniref:TNFSF9 n=1 Tax=Lepidosiren paradoxus TaxID=7883 RepID=A0A6G6CW92_LEPPA|nr:TNFSF9 [Lepidosiren paradoxa]
MTTPASEKEQTSVDPESLTASQPSWRKLDIFLLVSVMLLFAGVTGIAGGMVYSVWTQVPSPRSPASKLVQNSAHLEAVAFEIKNETMTWHTNANTGSNLFAEDFWYDPKSSKLQVKEDGVYYVYAQLSVSNVVREEKEDIDIPVSMTVHRQNSEGESQSKTEFLKLEIKLPVRPAENHELISKFTAALIHLSSEDKLFVSLEGPSTIAWQLSQGGKNFFGLFRVDGNAHARTKV